MERDTAAAFLRSTGSPSNATFSIAIAGQYTDSHSSLHSSLALNSQSKGFAFSSAFLISHFAFIIYLGGLTNVFFSASTV
jgi:hypothetical protein